MNKLFDAMALGPLTIRILLAGLFSTFLFFVDGIPCCGQELASTKASVPNEASPSQITEKPKFRFEMQDGTRINGFADIESLEVDLGFGKVEIPIGKIRSLTLTKSKLNDESQDNFVIEMQNRDRYTGLVLNPPLAVRFLGGEVTLPFDGMKSVRFLSGGGSSGSSSDGLAVYYDFEGVSEREMENRLGGGNDLLIGPGIKRVESKYSRGVSFKGSGSLQCDDSPELRPQRFTFSVLIKPTMRDGEYIFVGGKSKHEGWLGGFAFVYMQGDTDNIYFYVNGYDRNVVKCPLPLKKWTHLSGTFDGEKVSLYANGKLTHTVPYSTGGPISYSEDPFTIGGEAEGFYLHGEMDEISLHNRALSATEIKELYNSIKD